MAKSGDDKIEIYVAGSQEPKANRDRALETLRKLRRPFPPGFRFDRDEANAR